MNDDDLCPECNKPVKIGSFPFCPHEPVCAPPAIQIFESFETRNILPDGANIRVHSKSQLSRLCNEYGLAHTPEPDKIMRDGKLYPKEKSGVIYSR